ncbi:E3 ubiquitin-protein ligase RNF19B-like [Boleophthalmus pectinirostris]|uniref:E3 ubiquitin-protein ligase RNF19B-like n=1 Tax=Boleophthalmus pectinirostris TaxID=150288 RepID=UPI002430F466|nr:E3 ubiquitin-protein ligase RNF19B-like [Boleophthalmus pectinirostris]
MEDSPEKSYDPFDSTLVFVDRKDDLDPFSSEDGNGQLRAQMSCGHAVTPDSLTQWSCHQLDQGNYKFKCPAIVEGTRRCNKPWSYQEVRRLADLSVEEMQYFEENIARLAAAEHSEIQPCPRCKSNVERKDLTNLCVVCPVCTADQGKSYQFCWQCQKPWKGAARRSDHCDNDGCSNKNLELLQTCKTIDLPEVQGATNCPSVRACPECGIILEHSRKYCKNLICPRCHAEFCFVCLKLKETCNKTSTPYNLCQGGVAPRQTSIPVWIESRQESESVEEVDDISLAEPEELYLPGPKKRRRWPRLKIPKALVKLIK